MRGSTNASVYPGGTIGVVGGGQLGRMFCVAAARLGYRTVVWSDRADGPAASVAGFEVVGDYGDIGLARQFARRCDVITFEFENIPAQTIAACQNETPTHPASNVLAISQDRVLEKSTLQSWGLPVTPFAPIASTDEARRFGLDHGVPFILKTCRDGYDGKGQHRIDDLAQLSSIDLRPHRDGAIDWIAERMISFTGEASVIVARSTLGETKMFGPIDNVHVNHILDLSTIPSRMPLESIDSMLSIASRSAKAIGLVGLLCIEFFIDGVDVMINEIAPRPHNSGHVTIEACHTDQFEQHVRAVCGLPLGDTSPRFPASAMLNLLGCHWPTNEADWQRIANGPVHLHHYGKSGAASKRKLGHLTATGNNFNEVIERLRQARGDNRPPIGD